MKKNQKAHFDSNESPISLSAYGLLNLQHPETHTVVEDLLAIQSQKPNSPPESALQELHYARALNFDLPANSNEAIQKLELTIQELLSVESCVIHLLSPLESIQPNALSVAPYSNRLQRNIVHQNRLLGELSLQEKLSGKPFTRDDERQVDLLLPYLAVQVERLANRQECSPPDQVRHITRLLGLSKELLNYFQNDTIFPLVLQAAQKHFDFSQCSYIAAKSSDDSTGEILYEVFADSDANRHLLSYSHVALEGQRQSITNYDSLLARVNAETGICFLDQAELAFLGFELSEISGMYFCPVSDNELNNPEVLGLLCFALPASLAPLNATERLCLKSIADLTSQACSRALQVDTLLMQAMQDELTGLMTRKAFYQRFEAEIERARRYQTPLTVALIDVDFFKKFNDTYGHLSGDLVLKHLATLLAQNLRRSDVICRFGGEEFAILLPDTSLKVASDLLERLRISVAQNVLTDFSGQVLKITISAGLAHVNTQPHPGGMHESEMLQALAMADEELYRAKGQGRNQICHALQADSDHNTESFTQAS
jgi:diguanylate cyclase (GGDEF)-like protein